VDVAVTELRAQLRHWLSRVREGDEVIITEHGMPIARLLALDSTATLERLTAEGVIAKPERGERRKATGRAKPRPKRSIAARVTEQRR
jgi:prevent-host-death family protein